MGQKIVGPISGHKKAKILPHSPRCEHRRADESEKVYDRKKDVAGGAFAANPFGVCTTIDRGCGMTSAQITFIEQYRKTESLLERARRRRDVALGRRMACIIQTSKDGEGVVEHVFSNVPQMGELIARTGPDVRIVGFRMEPLVGRKICDVANAAP